MTLRLRILTILSLSFLVGQILWAKDAFIIIDMQPVFVTRKGYDVFPDNQKKISEILEKQIASIKKARENGTPVVVIEYVHPLVGNSRTHNKLMSALEGYDFYLFKKDTDGAFDSSKVNELKKYLTKNQIDNLIIAGANGGACVYETISGALRCGYKVSAIEDLIADFNSESFIYPYVGRYDEFNGKVPFKNYDCFATYLARELNAANKGLDEIAAKIPGHRPTTLNRIKHFFGFGTE